MEFSRRFSGSEILLWRFIQNRLHDYFAKLGSDLTVCSYATAMLYVSGFRNSDYVGFDLSKKVTTIYSSDEVYLSPLELVKRLPLSIEKIKDYRAIIKNSPFGVKMHPSEKSINYICN